MANISVLDNLEPKSGGNIANLTSIKSKININLMSILDITNLAKEVSKADIIINCAASTSHSRSMSEPFFDLDVNIRGVLNILECIKRYNKKCKFIHLGTTTQMGELMQEPADEKHCEFPNDIYSANKSVSEKYVLIYANAFDLDCSVLRISNTYGPRASIHSPEFTFNNYFIGQCLQDKAINIYGNGLQKRSLIFVEDVVDAIIKSMISSNNKGKTMLVTSDDVISVREIAELMVKISGKGSVQFIRWPEHKRKLEVGNQIFDNSQAKKLLNWKPSTSLEDGLTATFEFFNKHYDEYIQIF